MHAQRSRGVPEADKRQIHFLLLRSQRRLRHDKLRQRPTQLSGGQQQRVAIARTLVKDPPILILDEATSALDSRTEAEIQDTLAEVSKQRTTVIIAHRLSTIVDADEIVVLDAGRVAERGNHAALLRKNGLYAEMWARQQAESDEGAEAA